jgi:metal-responsive CopG/Arc/MetJ family transcriptional regulator
MKGYMQQIAIGLPPEIVDAVDAAAYRENRSRAKVIEEALRQALNLPRPDRATPARKRGRRARPLQLTQLAVSA